MQINYSPIVAASRASEYLNSRLGDRLASLSGIKVDLRIVQESANAIRTLLERQPVEKFLIESLTWHVVLRYARCFDSDSDGRKASLSLDHIKGLSQELQTLHAGIIDRRMKTFAHAGEHCKHRTIVHLMPPAKDGSTRLELSCDIEAPGPIVDPEQAVLIARLASELMKITDRRISKAWPAMRKEIESQHEKLVTRLTEIEGRHATPEQTAVSVMRTLRY